MELIKSIREVTDQKGNKDDWISYAGYEIETSKQTIRLLISNEKQCCENWGYFMSEDDLESFIGADLREIVLVDTALNTKQLDSRAEYGMDEGGLMFVNLNTDRGTLQFVAYNSHNGYYGHDARVESEQLSHEVTL